MLVLTRKQQEKICIGDGITITILKVKGKAIRLGIEAPSHVPVLRGELLFEIERRLQDEGSLGGENDSEQTSAALTTSVARMRQPGWTAGSSAVAGRVSRTEADKLRGPLRAMLNSRTGGTG